MSSVCHIVVAAGSGTRFGSALPKQFCDLNGRPLLMTTIERLRYITPEARIILVLSGECVSMWQEMCASHSFLSPEIVEGGNTRWQSVCNALQSVPYDVDVVTVHDGARPVVTRSVVDAVIKAVENGAHGAIPAVAVTDSLRMVDDSGMSHAVDRSVMRAVQTPQAFRAQELIKAYAVGYRPEFTDDASVMEYAGFAPLHIVDGSPANIKVTHPFDLAVAAMLLDVTPASH
ncbi:MAG: 2-C-methyl-D-erythritol 4-phosphate cytidylyltransferase [Paramuribaculum sp.]|nr:2-C-methyl-D-erythritol 4-phosphate cytidylyltransferase [Paramuribaculum sp.]